MKNVRDSNYQKILSVQVDLGEASAIALALENENSLLLMNDLKGRKLALQLNVKITVTLGVIHLAKSKGIISEVKPIIDKILATNFRISPTLIQEFLRINNEL